MLYNPAARLRRNHNVSGMIRGIVFVGLKQLDLKAFYGKSLIYARIQKQGKSKDVVYKPKLIMEIEDFR